MAEEQGEEKTEEPTSKRLDEARQRGELPRSPDFGGAIEVLVICALLFLLGGGIVESLSAMLISSLTFSSPAVDAERDLPLLLGQRVLEGFWAVKWLMLSTFVVALLAATRASRNRVSHCGLNLMNAARPARSEAPAANSSAPGPSRQAW